MNQSDTVLNKHAGRRFAPKLNWNVRNVHRRRSLKKPNGAFAPEMASNRSGWRHG